LEKHTADNGFQIPPAFNPAGNIYPGLAGKGDQMKGIAGTEIIPQEFPGHIVV
jgi:hypothetical protein